MLSGRKYEVDDNGMQSGPSHTQQPVDPYHVGYNQPTDYGQQPTPVGQQPTAYGYPTSTSSGDVIYVNNNPRGRDWLIPAVLSCLCCFWPTGICAIVAAVNARRRYDVGDHTGGKSSGRWAKILTLVSLGVGLACIILVIVLSVTVLQSGKDPHINTRNPFGGFSFTTRNPYW